MLHWIWLDAIEICDPFHHFIPCRKSRFLRFSLPTVLRSSDQHRALPIGLVSWCASDRGRNYRERWMRACYCRQELHIGEYESGWTQYLWKRGARSIKCKWGLISSSIGWFVDWKSCEMIEFLSAGRLRQRVVLVVLFVMEKKRKSNGCSFWSLSSKRRRSTAIACEY